MALDLPLSKDERKLALQRSDMYALYYVAVNFGILALAFWLPTQIDNPAIFLVSILLITSRILGLGVLTHDASHNALFKNAKVNEWMGRWVLGGLPNVPFFVYRKGHMAHHRYGGTDKDPDLGFVAGYPTSRASLIRKFKRDLTGQTGIKDVLFQLRNLGPVKSMPFLISHAILFALLALSGHPAYYGLWWIALIFIYPAFMRIRIIGEHGAVDELNTKETRLYTRTTNAPFWQTMLFSPNNVNFHVEHHLFPAAPSYRLKKLHALLVGRGYYDGYDCVNKSFFQAVARCVGERRDENKPVVRSAGIYAGMR
jgi:fatty acid desaturase